VPGDDKVGPQAQLTDTAAERIRTLIKPLFSLISGGENAGLGENSSQAIRLVGALRDLAVLHFGQSAAVSPRSLKSGSALFEWHA
jgi:hypothetical protein